MQDLMVSPNKKRSTRVGRRTILKSAAALLGSGFFYLNSEKSYSQEDKMSQHSNNGSLHKGMVGFMLAHEQFPVSELVKFGIAAEHAGFDLLATSDHLQPWQANEGHSGAAWVTMGAVGQRTQHVWIGPTVT